MLLLVNNHNYEEYKTMTIINVNKDCLISEDQDSITLNLSDDYLLLKQPESKKNDDQQSTDQDNPWVKYAGMFQDDPQFDEFLAEINSYRQELDNEI
jgi:hypothetical protein